VLRRHPLDALFFHTQVTALFAQGLMARIPSVVSMDATPLGFDSIGLPYDHVPSVYPPVEAIKNALTRRTFNAATRLITWHEWGKESLIRDYAVDGKKILVVPPGIDLERWNFPRASAPSSTPVRLLFVGGDFRRKGGYILLDAFKRSLADSCTLDIVTRETVSTDGLRNVRVHHGMAANAPELLALYSQADIFVFPTFADTLPLVIMEALASSLPVITTNVGALREEVQDGYNGLVVPPRDVSALADATLRLVRNPLLRAEMSAAARLTADRKFNGAVNYRRLLDICKDCANSTPL
jgi:glycosyltransferase involved in cell wall biosynthesis